MPEIQKRVADETVRFPLRVASIDVGSNALRFIAAEFQNRYEFSELLRDRYPLRLGHDVFISGRMTPETIDSALSGLGAFYDHIQKLDVKKYRAVATSAVRESRNGDELIGRVKDEIGLELEKISGSEESRLIHFSVKRRVPLGKEQWILADVGGGSVEVSLVDEAGILWSESLNLGSVRLLEEFAGSEGEPEGIKNLFSEYIQTLRIPAVIQNKKPAGFIATGGNIETISSLIDLSGQEGVSRVPIQELRNLIEKLSSLSYHDRIRELDLKEDRADVILPASLVYERLAVIAGADEVIVPHAELREGIVLDLVV